MDAREKEKQLNELWDAYVLSVPGMDQVSGAKDRAARAIEMLRVLHLDYKDAVRLIYASEYDLVEDWAETYTEEDWAETNTEDAGEYTSPAEIARHARIVWQLISIEFADLLMDPLGLDIDLMDADQGRGNERTALKTILGLSKLPMPHTHRNAFDPLPCMLPKWLFSKLSDALDALDEGEVQLIVSPSRVGRHDDAWTWDQMRSGVLEHLYFLFGQDKPISRARQIVSEATGISVETIRSWEKLPKLTANCQLAVDAGELKAAVDIDPTYVNNSGNLVGHRVLARLQIFESQPLSIFGRQYREKFGHRHNQSLSGGNRDRLPPLD